MTSTINDGTVEVIDGSYELRYTRHLRHSIEQVWAALTEPEQLVKWLADATIDLREGGTVELRWLNTDDQGNTAVARGPIAQLDPPHLIEIDTDIHGRLRWELQRDKNGSLLTFTVRHALPDEYLILALAGWHSHLDFLEEALDGKTVDWPNWPRDRWQAHHDRYLAARSH